MPEESLDDVERKQETWEASLHDEKYRREKLRADLFVGAFFAEKTKASSQTVPYTEDLARIAIVGIPQRIGVEDTVDKLGGTTWILPLALGLCRCHARGGFDVVLGNPPMGGFATFRGRVLLQFVRQTSPVCQGRQTKSRAISELKETNPLLWIQYQLDRREYDARNAFCRSSGRYPSDEIWQTEQLCPVCGNISTQILSPMEGHSGLIVQTNIATDDSKKVFFEEIVTKKRLVSLYDFQNKEGIFPGVHRSTKFCLLTLSGGTDTLVRRQSSLFPYTYQVEQLRERERRRFSLATEDFTLIQTQHSNLPDLPDKNKTWRSPARCTAAPAYSGMKSRGNDPRTKPLGHKLLFQADDQHDKSLPPLPYSRGIGERRLAASR